MSDSWIDPNVFLIVFTGLAFPALGLGGLVWYRLQLSSKFDPTRLALCGMAALTVFSAVNAALEQSFRIWLPPLLLALALGGMLALRLRLLANSFRRMLGILQQPVWQCGLLIAIGPILASGWPLICDLPQVEPLEEPYFMHPAAQQVDMNRFQTDRGRQVAVVSPRPEEEPQRLRWERANAVSDLYNLPEHSALVAPASGLSNCHGWVFTGGRYLLHEDHVALVLEDNGYAPVNQPQRGDLAIYRDSTQKIIHTGVVHAVCVDGEIQIRSKWGRGGVYIHPPNTGYQGEITYYRSPREGHLLKEAAAESSAGEATDLVRNPSASSSNSDPLRRSVLR